MAKIVISILFVAKSDENAFQSRTKQFFWARLASGLKFENFKKPIGPRKIALFETDSPFSCILNIIILNIGRFYIL